MVNVGERGVGQEDGETEGDHYAREGTRGRGRGGADERKRMRGGGAGRLSRWREMKGKIG